MNRRIVWMIAVAVMGILTGWHCAADSLPQPTTPEVCLVRRVTYDVDIKPIIDTKCAYSGCHLDVGPGFYTTYEGLLGVLENGDFRTNVVVLKDDPNLGMPPDYVDPDSLRNLTQHELDLVECWLRAGYPEN